MVRSKCNLKTHVGNLGYPFPYKSGAQNHFFGQLRNLRANLTAYIYGMKYDIHKRANALQTTRGLLHHPKRYELWSAKGFKLDRSFYPPTVNSSFHFIARLRRRRSANGTQPHFVKRWTVGRANDMP